MAAYCKYAGANRFDCEIVYDSDSAWSLLVKGKGCWEAFEGESGKHVVTRVPASESRGRRHTSTVAVAVLPMSEGTGANPGTLFSLNEVEVITQRGHGKGGQHQNKVETAVRVIHRDTGISVFINGRSQQRNKQLALEILRARVEKLESEAASETQRRLKSDQIGSGSRSGRIRTYNFIRSFVVDHRTGRKTPRLDQVMKGRFDLLM